MCEDLVQQCMDDRTMDFALALIDFVKWHNTLAPDHALSPHATGQEAIGEGGTQGSDLGGPSTHTAPHTAPNSRSSSSHYQWPEFILDMLKRPVEWASWRKRVERAVLSNRDTGTLNVLFTILSLYFVFSRMV